MDSGTKSVKRWTDRLGGASPKNARGHLRRFLKWLHDDGGPLSTYTPDQLVEYQQNSDNGNRFDILDAVQNYVTSLDTRASTKQATYSYLRSFFSHNRAELPRDAGYKIRSEIPRVQGKLTVEHIRNLVLSSDPCHRAVFTCMFQAAMGLDEIVYWNQHGWTRLKADLKDDPEVIRVQLAGRKHMRNKRSYYTFLGGDAIQAIKAWLSHRPADATVIFVNIRGVPLTKSGLRAYWLRHLRKIGLVGPQRKGDVSYRTGLNPHELRDVFRSQWSKSPAKYEVGEYFMGHVVDPFEYDKSFRDVAFYRREYLKALPHLQIMSSGIPFGRVEQSEVEQLQDAVRALKEQLQEMQTVRRESDDVMNRLFQDQEFQRFIERKLKTIG
jgi:integrase